MLRRSAASITICRTTGLNGVTVALATVEFTDFPYAGNEDAGGVRAAPIDAVECRQCQSIWPGRHHDTMSG
jgi:hypothetical protein